MLTLLVPALVWATPDPEEAAHEASELNILNGITLGQILVLLTAIATVVGFFKMVNPVLHRLSDLLDDWNGEPARPGVPERKGVMERMGAQEEVLLKQDEVMHKQDQVLSHLRRQVEPIVDATAAGNHAEVLSKLTEINFLVTTNHGDLQRMKRLLARHIREEQAWIALVDKATAERNFTTPPWPQLPDDPDDDGYGPE